MVQILLQFTFVTTFTCLILNLGHAARAPGVRVARPLHLIGFSEEVATKLGRIPKAVNVPETETPRRSETLVLRKDILDSDRIQEVIEYWNTHQWFPFYLPSDLMYVVRSSVDLNTLHITGVPYIDARSVDPKENMPTKIGNQLHIAVNHLQINRNVGPRDPRNLQAEFIDLISQMHYLLRDPAVREAALGRIEEAKAQDLRKEPTLTSAKLRDLERERQVLLAFFEQIVTADGFLTFVLDKIDIDQTHYLRN